MPPLRMRKQVGQRQPCHAGQTGLEHAAAAEHRQPLALASVHEAKGVLRAVGMELLHGQRL